MTCRMSHSGFTTKNITRSAGRSSLARFAKTNRGTCGSGRFECPLPLGLQSSESGCSEERAPSNSTMLRSKKSGIRPGKKPP